MINTSFNIHTKENHFCGMIQVHFISSALIITMQLLRGKALKNRDTYHFLSICYKSQSRSVSQPTITLFLFTTIGLNSKTAGAFEVGQKFQDTAFLGA
jgi:hypothetical protein